MAHEVAEHGVHAELRADVSRRLLDLLGICIRASTEAPARAVGTLVARWGGTPEATAIGLPDRLPAATAALLNGTLAHSLDFDDTHLPSVLHPSASVIPAALATAERHNLDGSALLDAAAVGIEVVCRLGMAGYDKKLGNSVFFERGQHATAICGAIGAAVAVGMLMRQTTEELVSSIGVACSMGAGILEANRTGGTVKRVHCGWAAHAGTVAAEMVNAGITGPPTALEGRFGFFHAFIGNHFDLNELTQDLGEKWTLPDIFFKPYPCNHFTHAGVDAALRLRASGLRASEVEALTLAVPTPVLRTIAEPRQDKIRPQSGYHAAFSGPYTVASAFLGGGGLGLAHEDFTNAAAADPERLALAEKVECVASEKCDDIFPHQFPAVLTARLRDGTTRVEEVLVNRGGPANPLSTEELRTKFSDNAEPIVGALAANNIAHIALTMADRSTAELGTALQAALRTEQDAGERRA
ncbi:MmgE/PrpD family protein [Streptomyces solisilvae]|uniref:MmgE/PrpD family protein n=1 Tax=Streptomyces malaysiensis TaxID=92644 RepID=UPI0036AF8816